MSWKASGYIKSLSTSPDGEKLTRSEKLLLLCLADCHNTDDNGAWPSIAALAEDSMMSDRHVRRILLILEKKGVISIEHRLRNNGTSRSNFYRFPGLDSNEKVEPIKLLPNPPHPDKASPSHPDAKSVSPDKVSGYPDIAVSGSLIEPQEESFNEPKERTLSLVSEEIKDFGEESEDFKITIFNHKWDRYPLKDGKKEAQKHFLASVKTYRDLQDLDKALTNYLGHLALKPWKEPKAGKTFFNNWRDWVTWKEPEKAAPEGDDFLKKAEEIRRRKAAR